jgi:hypothetical protein
MSFLRNLTIMQKIRRATSNAGANGAHSTDAEPFTWDWQTRRDDYRRWATLYDNAIYDDQALGGSRETIITDVLKKTDTTLPLHGFFNPMGVIADAYQQVMRGKFGRDIKIVAASAAEDQQPAETQANPLNPAVVKPLSDVWRWSNLDEQKDVFQYWAANLGSVGLRVEAKVQGRDGAELDASKRRVRLVPVHPGEIVDFNEDAQGNVTDVLLEYTILQGELGEKREDVTYRELLGKDQMVKFRDEVEIESIPNALGVCPFVLLRHRDVGREFGVPSHFGTETIIHHINWLLTRMGISVDRHVFAKWFAAAGGAPPVNFDLGDTSVAYVQTGPGDTSPKLEAIVAKLDFVGIYQVLLGLIAHVRHRQPELTLAYLEALSGQSGETIAKLLIPFEQRILAARTRYEHALVRGLQMGLSWGVLTGMWDLGSGVGDKAKADAAYQRGLEDFAFNERSALPETVFDKINRAKADAAPMQAKVDAVRFLTGVTSSAQQMRMMGMDEKTVQTAQQEKRAEDVAMNNQL